MTREWNDGQTYCDLIQVGDNPAFVRLASRRDWSAIVAAGDRDAMKDAVEDFFMAAKVGLYRHLLGLMADPVTAVRRPDA